MILSKIFKNQENYLKKLKNILKKRNIKRVEKHFKIHQIIITVNLTTIMDKITIISIIIIMDKITIIIIIIINIIDNNNMYLNHHILVKQRKQIWI